VKERFGIVPVGPNLIYWVAVAKAPAGERDECDPRERLRKTFGDWHPPIDDLLANTPADRILRTDLFDRPPIASWTDGRAVLLGDAAHPMTPNLGQGACQAIEDAIVLANAIHRQPTLEKALTHYEHRRIAHANSFVTRSHRFGQIAHWENPALRWLRNGAIRSFSHLPRQFLARAAARDFQFHF
jgi:2-polyprenyl-6-methoxyphenol hydroxylase-like FAD-dependent oxidoreductase